MRKSQKNIKIDKLELTDYSVKELHCVNSNIKMPGDDCDYDDSDDDETPTVILNGRKVSVPRSN